MELFKRTGSEDFPLHLKMMISGPPKSGKTSLLGTVPNIVIADTEPHANNLQSVAHLNLPFVTVNGSDDLQRLLFVMRDPNYRAKAAEQLGMPSIEAVAIDTMDTLQAIMKKERVRATGHDFLRDDWGWIKEEMTSIIQSFTTLPMHVFFTVHTKTKEIGKGDDTRTIVVPGLEGSIAETIAGMVGYSVLSFRKEEIRSDGSKYTKYWLRTEGDETYDYLGTRTAGRLPEVIEPDFATILKAAMDGRPKQQPEPVQLEIQTTAAGAPAQVTQVTQTPSPQTTTATHVPGQNTAGNPGPDVTVAPPQQPAQTPPTGDNEPVSAAALMHVKKVYDALGVAFPEDVIKALKIGQARQLVMVWRAAQEDQAAGKGEARQVMTEYLDSMGWLPADLNGKAPKEQVTPASLEEATTIADVQAWAGDDLGRVQQAYDAEAAKDKPRSSLLDALVRKGAKPVQTSVQTEPTPAPVPQPDTQPEPQPQPAPDPEPTPAPEPAPEPLPEPAREQAAVAAVEDKLGGQVVGDEINENSTCAGCGKTVDDVDIAKLSHARYHKVLCVNDYIAETKRAVAVG